MGTFHLHINGIVQGVGFRPMVYQLAKSMRIAGYVKNGGDGVHVFFNAEEEIADEFVRKVKVNAPNKSRITAIELCKIPFEDFTGFTIAVEADNLSKQTLISPDISLCSDCQSELHDPENRRYRYPFITCTQCGPRYSIIGGLPYERENTAMSDFEMCGNCKAEYSDVTDRRFFSQTNSCKDCGVQMHLWKQSEVIETDSEAVLDGIKSSLEEGKILAVKGIGGYLLFCDANAPATIALLRQRKHRPSKPFAVLYPNIASSNADFEMNSIEMNLLQSDAAPIVLLHPKQYIEKNISIKNIAPGLNKIGIMLPNSPLMKLIANDFGKPLIATSANISGSPIIYKDADAIEDLSEIVDFIVSCNREILIPQDDSVVQISKSGQPVFLRRSRGFALSFLNYIPRKDKKIVSTGAFLKSTFSIAANGNTFVSQFLGSGESYESQQMYKHTLEHWLRLYNIQPENIVADLHPGYFSHRYALEIEQRFSAEIQFIQHHEAHFAAVLAENNLMQSEQPILGIIWDGTGLGSDGNIWGGEFFKYEDNEMQRYCHFEYFPVIAGDKMAHEPRISALCASINCLPESQILKNKFTEAEWVSYQSLTQSTRLFTSSVGRLFDAVASLLNLSDKQTYEGEAAMYLQVLAEKYIIENGFEMPQSYYNNDLTSEIPTSKLIKGVIVDIQKGESKGYIAAKFHFSLVKLIEIVVENTGIRKICFSGGVFQNALLADWITKEYKDKYELYFHQVLSPNDENISFGQLAYFDNDIKSISKPALKEAFANNQIQSCV